MASKRHLRRKQCDGKIKYPDALTAHRSAGVASDRSSGWISSYKCEFCGFYHIGHPPKKIKRLLVAKRNGLQY